MNNKFLANFYCGGIFHVYNRTNNKELLFRDDDNRLYFLQQYVKYLLPFVDTFCWNLLPNHFHLLIRIKEEAMIKSHLLSIPTDSLKGIERKYLEGDEIVETLIEFEWKRFFTAYAMAFNKKYRRSGNLFYRPFKRLEVIRETHFTRAIVYIHANAFKHKLCNDFREHAWSSWHSLLSDKFTQLCRHEVLEWFGSLDEFIKTHITMVDYYYDYDNSFEDEQR